MMAKLDENKTCSLHYAADMCRALIDGLADQVDQCRGIVTGADLAENSVSVACLYRKFRLLGYLSLAVSRMDSPHKEPRFPRGHQSRRPATHSLHRILTYDAADSAPRAVNEKARS